MWMIFDTENWLWNSKVLHLITQCSLILEIIESKNMDLKNHLILSPCYENVIPWIILISMLWCVQRLLLLWLSACCIFDISQFCQSSCRLGRFKVFQSYLFSGFFVQNSSFVWKLPIKKAQYLGSSKNYGDQRRWVGGKKNVNNR